MTRPRNQNEPVARKMPNLVGRKQSRRIGRIANDSLPLFLDEVTLERILVYSSSERRREIGGFLIGNYCSDRDPFIHVEHFLPASGTDSRSGSLTFTHATWERLREQIESGFPNQRVVGWHHTHPSMGIFLSSYDRFIQDHFFDQQWQVAMVVDPCQQQFGFFQWSAGELINNGFVLIPQTESASRQRNFVYG